MELVCPTPIENLGRAPGFGQAIARFRHYTRSAIRPGASGTPVASRRSRSSPLNITTDVLTAISVLATNHLPRRIDAEEIQRYTTKSRTRAISGPRQAF
jgi:hypothetical protein